MIATICSSVNRPFRIAPSESGASLSTNRWSENPAAGHRVHIGKAFSDYRLCLVPSRFFRQQLSAKKSASYQLNKKTGNRIRYRKVDAETGDEVEQGNIIKGYEVSKGDYIEVDPDELEAVAIKSKHTIEIDEFVPKSDIDELYMRDPYFIVPDGEVGQQAQSKKLQQLNKDGKRTWETHADNGLGEIVIRTHLPYSGYEGRDTLSRNHINALTADLVVILGRRETLRYCYRGVYECVPDPRIRGCVANHSTSVCRIFLGGGVRGHFLSWISSWILGSLWLCAGVKPWLAARLEVRAASDCAEDPASSRGGGDWCRGGGERRQGLVACKSKEKNRGRCGDRANAVFSRHSQQVGVARSKRTSLQ